MEGPLRIIFPATVLLLWVLFGVGLASGEWTATQWLMLLLGHLSCSIIFVSFIYVFNYGYGLSVTFIGIALLVLMPSLATAVVSLTAVAFGLRLTRFTHLRYQSASYAASHERQKQASAALPQPVRLMLWVFVSWLMSFELMAVYFVARSGELTGAVTTGAAVMLAGLLVEAIADQQKQAAKARQADAFVRGGLFRYARHINYTGEILFQAGLIIAALGCTSGWWETLAAVAAPGYIVVLMVISGRNADRQHEKRYGADPAYQAYRAATGCFLPGL